MRSFKIVLFTALCVFLFSRCQQEAPLVFHTGFEELPTGPISTGSNWNAAEGNAEIITDHRRNGEKFLRFSGGESQSVVWTPGQPLNGVRHIVFQAMPLSGNADNSITVEKYAGEEWQELGKVPFPENDNAIQIISVDNEGAIEKIRLTSNMPDGRGLLIDNFDLLTDSPMQVSSVIPHAPVYPILTNKENNPVLEIKVHAEGIKQPVVLSSLEISLEGSADLKNIESAKIFYSGNAYGFTTDTPFGDAQSAGEKLVFSGDQPLEHGQNSFWLSLTLNPEADMLSKIKATCTNVVVDGKSPLLTDTLPNPAKRIGYALRQHNEGGVHTYRIPGLATTNEGTLIAVYDIRYDNSSDLQGDIDVGLSRSTDGGNTWEPMKVIMDMGEWGSKPEDQNGIGDPAVLVDRQTNTIWVAGLWVHGYPDVHAWGASQPGMTPGKTGQVMLTKSEDDGLTWSEPINITSQIKNPEWYLILQGPGKGITMSDGTLVFPAQFKDENEIPHSTIMYSKDRGKTWEIGTGAKSNTTEAQVVELDKGTLMLNMRDNRGSGPEGRNGTGARSVAITKDLGKTWTQHPTSRDALPEPVCNAGLIKHTYQDQELLIFINPDNRYVRRDMTIKVSTDQGMTWPEKYHTLLDEGLGRGYPMLTTIDENTIGVLYEGSQADLVFQKILVEDLLR